MVVIRGRLDRETGAVLRQALDASRARLFPINKNVPAGTFPGDGSLEPPTMAQQQADALGLIAETALHHGIRCRRPG
jgi:hypothetical protein